MSRVTVRELQLAEASGASQGGPRRTNPSDDKEGRDGVDRADPMEKYEKELTYACWWAFIIGSLHASSRFLSKCNLICATVVILGSFAQYLVPQDYDSVVCLLVIDGVRLGLASFSTRLFMRALVCLSQDPKSINHSQDKHYLRARWARAGLLVLQLICIFPGLIISGSRALISEQFKSYKSVDAHNVQKSICIFYRSVFINSIVALITFGCSASATTFFFWRESQADKSILRYYDKLLENAMAFGVMRADDFEFFSFAFKMLAAELSRNVQPEAVAKNHRHLIQYIYAHRCGVDFLQIYLNADDAFLQLAAVNTVGFWADRTWGVGVPKLRLPEELLTKLADKVGTGQVGWAATTSFGAIAASSSQAAIMVARTCTSGGEHLADRLAHLVDDSSSRSLSLVRTLVLLYEKLCEGKKRAPAAFGGSEVVAKLQKLAEIAKRHRLRVQAAYLLQMMDEPCDAGVIRKIDPTEDDHWFASEKSMLDLLRRATQTPPFEFLDPKRPAIRDDHTHISPPAWVEMPAPPASDAPE